jgi:hypothetical protein
MFERRSRARFAEQYEDNLQAGRLQVSHDGEVQAVSLRTAADERNESQRNSHDWDEAAWEWDSAKMIARRVDHHAATVGAAERAAERHCQVSARASPGVQVLLPCTLSCQPLRHFPHNDSPDVQFRD